MAHMRAMLIQRQTLGIHYDQRILDISSINVRLLFAIPLIFSLLTFQQLADIKMEDGSSPFILLTFMCQHINCGRDVTGKIIEGSEVRLFPI